MNSKLSWCDNRFLSSCRMFWHWQPSLCDYVFAVFFFRWCDHYSSGVVSFEPLQNQPPTLLSAVWRAELLTYGLKAQRSYARYGGATSEVKSAAAECKSVACLIWVDPVCNVGTKLLEVVWPKQTRVKNVPSALLYSNSTKYTWSIAALNYNELGQ